MRPARRSRFWDVASVVSGDKTPKAAPTGTAATPAVTRATSTSNSTTTMLTPCSMLQHDLDVHSAAFSPDGTRVVTTWAKRAQVWNAGSCQPVGAPLLHEDEVHYAAFSPDGGLVVTASKDRTARIWDAGTGAPVGEALHHPAGVRSATFSPDGTRLITAAGNTAYLWDVAPDAAITADELAAWLETIAGRRLDADGASSDLPDRQQRLADYCARARAATPNAPLTLTALVEWFCADRATRPLSPRAPVRDGRADELGSNHPSREEAPAGGPPWSPVSLPLALVGAARVRVHRVRIEQRAAGST